VSKAGQRFAAQVCDATMFNQRTNVWLKKKTKNSKEENAEIVLKKLLIYNSLNEPEPDNCACKKR